MKKFTALLAATVFTLVTIAAASAAAGTYTCWFPPAWKSKAPKAMAIAKALSKNSGLTIRPRIAKSYPQILTAFSAKQPSIVYVGSFVQAIIHARKLGTPLVQNINGHELYSGVMIYPKGQDPKTILAKYPRQIAYAKGADSGETSAKAATNGKAAIATANHGATCGAILAGKAKAGYVKNWWWDTHKSKYPTLAMSETPGISIIGNPDNVLTVSNSVPKADAQKIKEAAIASKDAFGAPKMVPFDVSQIQFSLNLMKKAKINPLTYSW
ncbi:MAG: phosphate/phosphite/phosphonate ABC transporter substrate-binding protein [Deltaproteobacteria bacterium]|nr:phosphate/phosphite/phosphonate ABC transporter substrate-binding protein [Deltaproteobacteria bacterium]